MNLRLRSCLNMLKPALHHQINVKHEPSTDKKVRHFNVGDRVYVRNFASGAKWIAAIVTKVVGPLSYECKTEHRDMKCHVDHIVSRTLKSFSNKSTDPIDTSVQDSTSTQDIVINTPLQDTLVNTNESIDPIETPTQNSSATQDIVINTPMQDYRY